MIFPVSGILSQKLMFYDKIIAKTDVMRQLPPPSPLLPLFPPSDEEEERHHYLPAQEVWGKELLRP